MKRSALFLAFALAACATRPEPSVATIDTKALARHVEVLASDAYEGRAPGTAGETKTLAYIVEQMKAAGLQPGNAGSWFQDVPLLSIEPSPGALLKVEGKQGAAAFVWGEDALVFNTRATPDARLDRSELIFAGYGVRAPERGWDDFAGADLRGKTVVMLPGVPAVLKDAPQLGGSAAKAALAAQLGAAGAVVITSPDFPDEQWNAFVTAERRPDLQLAGKQEGAAVDVRLRYAAADRLFAASGQDFAALRTAAGKPGFKPVVLGSRASVQLDGKIRPFTSKNVIGVLPGKSRPNEHVLFLAHWDHLGRCAAGEADPICNGAVDNASGVSGLIELARALANGKRPARSILFLATTAEEGGLMGAKHYVEHPVVPLASTVGGLGMDTIAVAGPADVVVLGAGLSPDMDRVIAKAAAAQGRKVVADKASTDFFPRSDHYPFAAAGVPVLIATCIFAPAAKTETDRYFADRYHKPADEAAAVRYDGAALDVDLARRVALELANGTSWPKWKPGTPFATARTKQGR